MLREWLHIEPQGHIYPAARTARVGTSMYTGAREGVPRVVRRVPYRVGQGQYRHRASTDRARASTDTGPV